MIYSFSTDRKLSIIAWDDEISRFTGKPPSAVLGKKYFDIFPRIITDDRDAISTVFDKRSSLTLRRYCFNCLIGHQMYADISIKPVITRNAVSSVEVSIVPDSTCSVTQNLQRSQQLIDIGKTASSLAHGVRNPLNAIKGAVVYLGEKYVQEPALIEFITIIKEEIARLDNFISKFLSTSLSDTGLSPTDINGLLKKIEIFVSLQARANNITTIYEYGNIPPITINSFQFEQAILNVINNAIEAMQSGGQLTLKTYLGNLSDKDFVVIEVSDTGPGIAQDKVNNLSMPSEEKGRGFGLFITREVLQYSGGHLEVKSRRGKGTTVLLRLPVQGG
jgi:two-component system nitrogen regulation sensor histidine kinase GlnL